jgi:hypothetical protein
VNPKRRNSASASTAASYSASAVTSVKCVMPSESVNDTRHRRLGTIEVNKGEYGRDPELTRFRLPRAPAATSAPPPSSPERIAPSRQLCARTYCT